MKPTYSSLLTKDDKQFLAHAKKALGFDYAHVMQDAQEAYQSHPRASVAKREANLVILAALKEIGEEHWRYKDGSEVSDREKNRENQSRAIAKTLNDGYGANQQGKTKSGTKASTGSSKILEMADEKLKR